jgi:hypothetical protein
VAGWLSQVDILTRWLIVQTILYPASGVAVTRVAVGRWNRAWVRPLP